MRRGRAYGLFIWYAVVSALPIAALGGSLAQSYDAQMKARALDQAASEADAISNAGIEPVLAGRDLAIVLTRDQRRRLVDTTRPLLEANSVLRLRLRDRRGTVVFDAAHPDAGPRVDADEDVQVAARGRVVRKLTQLNRDEVDAAQHVGASAVEAYLPVHGGGADHRVLGVLEIYLPFAPIAHSFTHAEHEMLALLVAGLVLLWLALSAISWSVTRRLRRSAAQNEHLALHDALTGLPNRALFTDRVAHAMAAASRTGEPVAIAVVDLDNFKVINDTFGHRNGDGYLQRIAASLAAVLRPGDTVARLGGDEFGVVVPGVDAGGMRSVLDRVQRTIAADVDVDGVPISGEASIGVAVWPFDATEADELMQCADLAMYVAKEMRGEIVEYSPEFTHFNAERVLLVGQLRRAIASNELELHYQPKLDLRSGTIASVEALVRWRHPERGLLAPGDFLDVAESTGLIRPLTAWVLDNAIEQVARWRADGLALTVAVNVSARNLRDETLAGVILERLAVHGLDADALEIEITETALITDPVRATALLAQIRRVGARIALDDFGQGYTSLGQLGTLPLDALKIDRSFVARMIDDDNARAIVTTIIDLGHRFELEVVAEGVETDEVLEQLRAMGCDVAQGFVLARPLPAADLREWVERYEAAHPPVACVSRRRW